MSVVGSPGDSDRRLGLDPRRTALVLVDLQGFTVTAQSVPLAGSEVLANAVRLAGHFRSASALVVLVRASPGVGAAMLLHPPADVAMPPMDLPPGSDRIPAELGPKPADVVVTKYNWGAFYATDLDAQLRRRAIDTLVVGGIATNFGVESTVRQAHEHGYAQVVVSDAVSAFAVDEHDMALERTFPRIARVRTTDEVLADNWARPD